MRKGWISIVAALAMLPLVASADPIIWGGNGHGYEAFGVEGGITWEDAKAAAEAMGGYLATITSEEENDFISDVLGVGSTAYWLGGFQEAGTDEPNGDWQWVTGEAFSYTNWASGEPNNLTGGNEDALAFAYFSATPGEWNDAPSGFLYGDNLGGYVVEFEVSEPGTLALLGLGLLAAGYGRSRKR